MNLRDLRYVIAIAEYRHFGRAADACNVSQPTLSAQVRKLEERLGVALFERTNKSVVPTAIGERVLRHARAAVEQADAIDRLAREARDPFSGPLRLGVIPTLSPYLMPLVLDPLRSRHPSLRLALWEDVTEALIDRLRRHRLDAALIATDLDDPDLTAIPLFTEAFWVALPHDHPLTGQNEIDERDLSDVDLLVLTDGHCLRDQALSACRRTAAETVHDLRASSLETVMNMAAAGYGATIVPDLAVARFRISHAGLTYIPLRGAGRTIRMILRRTFPHPEVPEAVAAIAERAVGRRD